MQVNNLLDHISGLRPEIKAAITRVLDRGWFVLGPEVRNFEQRFAAYIGVERCVTVANGTDALELTLRAAGVTHDSKVATVANAGMYTTTAIMAIGAQPVFMDVDLQTKLVTGAEVERVLKLGVRAVVVTHLYGLAIPEISAIASLCRKYGAFLIEDCAQAHGALIEGRQVGSFGDAGCFSFYPTKNLGGLGDGGAVVTHHEQVAEKIVHLRQYGWKTKYQVDVAGGRNSRMDEIQAAILSVMLDKLEGWNAKRRAIANRYVQRINNPAVNLPNESSNNFVAHLFVVTTDKRNELREHLKAHDIQAEIHYPVPDHQQPVFANRFSDVCLPHCEKLSQSVLTLPCYPEMVAGDVDKVINAVNGFGLDTHGR